MRRDAGYQLYRLQQGLTPSDWKPMTSVGRGVYEIRLRSKQEHRVFYVAKFKDAVYVLHAFEKKTQKTRQADIELGQRRLAAVLKAEGR